MMPRGVKQFLHPTVRTLSDTITFGLFASYFSLTAVVLHVENLPERAALGLCLQGRRKKATG